MARADYADGECDVGVDGDVYGVGYGSGDAYGVDAGDSRRGYGVGDGVAGRECDVCGGDSRNAELYGEPGDADVYGDELYAAGGIGNSCADVHLHGAGEWRCGVCGDRRADADDDGYGDFTGGDVSGGDYAGNAGGGELYVCVRERDDTLQPPDFTLSATPTSITMQRGLVGLVTLTMTPLNKYAGTATLSCSPLPANVTCVFLPKTLMGSGGTATTVGGLSITTSNRIAANRSVSHGVELAGLMLALLGLCRKKRVSRLLILLGMVGLCGAYRVRDADDESCGGR